MDLIDHLHPATVHFPIALLLLSSGGGLLYLFVLQRAEVRLIAWASMLLGWIGAAAAILSGLLAQSGLPPQAPYQRVLNVHIAAGLMVLVLYGVVLYQGWVGRSARARRERVRKGQPEQLDLFDDRSRRVIVALLLAAGALAVAFAGFNGGQLVFVWGVNVAP